MSRGETRIETVRVVWSCPCGGEMESTGTCKPVFPPLFTHRCARCEATEDLQHLYPRIEFREIL